MDSTLLFNPFPVVYMNFAKKKSLSMLVFCRIYCRENIYDISLFGKFLPQIRDPINLIYMSTTYLESFGADLSENELFKCVWLLILAMSILGIFYLLYSLIQPYPNRTKNLMIHDSVKCLDYLIQFQYISSYLFPHSVIFF